METWILEYRSPACKSPLFFIWYYDSDEKSTNTFMTFKSGEIFAARSLDHIKAVIAANFEELKEFDNLIPWLHEGPLETTAFDLEVAYQAILAQDFSVPVLKCLDDFISLFDDYVKQDESNNHLDVFMDNQAIAGLTEYYMNYIFWPKFNNKENIEAPPFEIDAEELAEAIKILMTQFEKNIKIGLLS
jgi:hypothetical protein